MTSLNCPTGKKCRSCGKQHVAGFVFCQRCAAPLEAAGDDEYSVRHASPVVLDANGAERLETAVVALLEDGKKDDAIRLYREAMATDFNGAQEAVEKLQERIDFVPASWTIGVPCRRSSGRHAVVRIFAAARAAIRGRLGV